MATVACVGCGKLTPEEGQCVHCHIWNPSGRLPFKQPAPDRVPSAPPDQTISNPDVGHVNWKVAASAIGGFVALIAFLTLRPGKDSLITPSAVVPRVEGTPFSVPSDPNAQFYLLAQTSEGSHAFITTKRVGTSGTTYSVREYDCAAYRVRYLGTADTRAAALSQATDPAKWGRFADVVPGAIADYVGQKACRR